MQQRINIQQRSDTLTLAPNETKRVNFIGSYISVLSNNTTVDVMVCADSGTTSAVKAGIGFPTVRLSEDQSTLIPSVFQYVEFTNPSNTETMRIEYTLSLGTVLDTRAVVQGYLQMDLSAPRIETPAAVSVPHTAAVVIASDSRVKERIVTNTGDFPVWFGDSNVNPDTKRGTPIYPQGIAVINCWGVVYFKAETSGSTISINNIIKV